MSYAYKEDNIVHGENNSNFIIGDIEDPSLNEAINKKINNTTNEYDYSRDIMLKTLSNKEKITYEVKKKTIKKETTKQKYYRTISNNVVNFENKLKGIIKIV